MNINELPPELLVRIFSNIDDFTEKIGLERICKHWRQTVSVNWNATKTCRKPLNDIETLGLVLNRCGEWLEELWLQNVRQIDENLVNQLARRMKRLKHLKLSECIMDGPAVTSIANLFGQQLYSFILDGTPYHPNMRGLIENESSKLEHLQISLDVDYFDYSAGTLPTKLPSNLKSFSLDGDVRVNMDPLLLALGRDCKNLKIFQLVHYSTTQNILVAIGKVKSLVYLNLDVNSIENRIALQNVICNELPNLKALDIGPLCTKEMISNISRARPDLVHLNVYAKKPFQIPDSLNSLTPRIWNTVDVSQFLSALLFEQPNKSIQHLDIRSSIFPSSSNFIKKLLGQFPALNSIHCQMPKTDAELTSFFSLIGKHLEKGRKIAIYLHIDNIDIRYYPPIRKYILPDDMPKFEAGWRLNERNAKLENLVLKKLIKEAIGGGNEPSFLDELWME